MLDAFEVPGRTEVARQVTSNCQVYEQKNLTSGEPEAILEGMEKHAEHHQTLSAADRVRRAIDGGGERVWSVQDFPKLPFPAVAQTLSRLARAGELQRVSKGLYYRPRKTAFGMSRPNPELLREKGARTRAVFPSGLTAANQLGFSTQVPAVEEVATTRGSLPRTMVGQRARVHTRRPAAWAKLSEREGALLDLIRRRAQTSELSPEETIARLLSLLREGGMFERLVRVAKHEPPRVRAMLGALGEELGKDGKTLEKLRTSLNPLTRFDFGLLSALKSAKEWQAKECRTDETLRA
ncbi:MAG: hypothetical protein KatS3mg108_2607 [Isosphaeraceae bacterium]|nr:MAG: hypothetical protein KatS3mg108_2607 [Isosphaeraceae bacterium]